MNAFLKTLKAWIVLQLLSPPLSWFPLPEFTNLVSLAPTLPRILGQALCIVKHCKMLGPFLQVSLMFFCEWMKLLGGGSEAGNCPETAALSYKGDYNHGC